MSAGVDIVVPTCNEAKTVAELYARLRARCPDARIIFVDNASTDGTLDILERLEGATLVRHATNLGYGRSLLDGVAAGSGELVVMIDADLEYHPEDVPALLAALSSSPAVFGSRFLGRSVQDRGMPLARRIGNGVVTNLFNLLFQQRLTDLYTGVRAVRREAFPKAGLDAQGFEAVLELAARLARAGIQIAEVPVSYTARTRGESKMRHIPEVLRFARRLLRLKLEGVTARV